MNRAKVLHISGMSPITQKFFPFLEENLDCRNHRLISLSEISAWPEMQTIQNISSSSKYRWLVKLLVQVNIADKIILHGLCGWPLVLVLALNPWLLKKCHWVIWGADLYVHMAEKKDWRWHKNEFFRRFVIKRIGHLATYIPGDVELARKWYGAKGHYHECLMYPSNLYKQYDVPQKEHTTINIQVGNSADPSNNHLEVFEKLLAYKGQDIKIYVPLSYGDQVYAKTVIEVGTNLFGDKFVSMTDFMPFEKYLEFLGQIDIAIFNHKRQQGMGNTITLLGLGKKVYMRNDVSSYIFFIKKGIKIFDIANLQMTTLTNDDKKNNLARVADFFSETSLKSQLEELFT